MEEKSEILNKAIALYKMWENGELGGEKMPEDSNPNLDKSSEENLIFFTLPMALNYQRNSYVLWSNALKTYNDKETNFVFNVYDVTSKSFEEVKSALTKYKLALQPNKQTEIWIKLSKSIINLAGGSLKTLYKKLDFDISKILYFLQQEHKKDFPYLSGTKICNYYLYVLSNYTEFSFKNKQCLSIAPDTHICKASLELGLITQEEYNSYNVQEIVNLRWINLLSGTNLSPIDLHTPLWLWSRNSFKEIKNAKTH